MRPRTIASVRDIARAHRVALVLTAIAIGTLAWLHPAGPGNSSPTDLAMVPAIGAVALWIYLSAERIRTPYGISMGLIVVAGCVSGILGPYLRGALVTVGYPEAPLIAVIQDIYLFVWCLAIVNLARTADALRVLLAAWVYASAFWAALLVIGVFIGVRALSGIEDNNGVRADGQFGDPNMASGFFAMSLFVLWSSAVPRRWWLRAAIAAARINRHHIADVDRGILLDSAALRTALAGADVLPHAIDAFHHAAIFRRQDAQDLAGLALVAARDHDDVVSTSNMSCHDCFRNQTTSLASETIFMKFFSRNSRATAPKIRVPRGLLSLSITTAAFLSKRT